MARSPIYSTQTRLRWSETWLDDSKNPVDLTNVDTTNATITLRILYPDGSAHAGTGTPTPINQAKGQFKYQVVPGDFPAPANATLPAIHYLCQYVCTYSNGEILEGDIFDIASLKSI